jgi:hypothetical protein
VCKRDKIGKLKETLVKNKTRFVGEPWATAVFCAAIILLLAVDIQAAFIGPFVTINAKSASGTASMTWQIPALPEDGSQRISLAINRPIGFSPSSDSIGNIEKLFVELDGDPAVNLQFAVNAGTEDTTFTITSAMVAFPGITNPQAIASAALTLTDGNAWPGNGGFVNVTAPNAGIFQATYNSGTVFQDLISSVALDGPGSTSTSAASGLLTIPGVVTDIQSEFSFILSAYDRASGTSRFEVVPEPTSFAVGLMGFVGLVTLRRRSARNTSSRRGEAC